MENTFTHLLVIFDLVNNSTHQINSYPMDLSFFLSMLSLRPLIDFGLVVLIWLVQLIIYPSFRYTEDARFKFWHQKYMGLISFFVVPLMFAQVAVLGMQCYLSPGWLAWLSAGLVLVIWITTFLHSVPMHNALVQYGKSSKHLEQLITQNWTRTILWTVVFVLGIISTQLS